MAGLREIAKESIAIVLMILLPTPSVLLHVQPAASKSQEYLLGILLYRANYSCVERLPEGS